MGNARIIFFLLIAIGAVSLLIWVSTLERVGSVAEVSEGSRLLLHPVESLKGISVVRDETHLKVVHEDGRWRMVAPFTAQVDQGRIAELIDVFAQGRAIDVVSLEEIAQRSLSLRDFGLAPAVARVIFEGEGWQSCVMIGALSPMGGEGFVRFDGSDQIVAVGAEVCERVPESADDLRARKLVEIERRSLRVIDIRVPGSPYMRLSREDDSWKVVQPAPARASSERVEELLDTLYGARVEYFVWPSVSNVMDVAESESSIEARLELLGLSAESGVQVQLGDGSAKGGVRLVFGSVMESDATLSYVLMAGGETIAALPAAVGQGVVLHPADLHDTHLFNDTPGSIRQMTIHVEGGSYAFRQSDGGWSMELPTSGGTESGAVNDSLVQLLRMQAEHVTPALNKGDWEEPVEVSRVELNGGEREWRFALYPDSHSALRYQIVFAGDPSAYHVASSNIPPALLSRKGVVALYEKRLFKVEPESVRRITIRQGKVRQTVERAGASQPWHLGDGTQGELDEKGVNVWLQKCCELEALTVERLGLSSSDMEQFGMLLPWAEISLDVDVTDAVRRTLLLGSESGSSGMRYAMIRGQDALLIVSGEMVEMLTGGVVKPLEQQ